MVELVQTNLLSAAQHFRQAPLEQIQRNGGDRCICPAMAKNHLCLASAASSESCVIVATMTISDFGSGSGIQSCMMHVNSPYSGMGRSDRSTACDSKHLAFLMSCTYIYSVFIIHNFYIIHSVQNGKFKNCLEKSHGFGPRRTPHQSEISTEGLFKFELSSLSSVHRFTPRF